MLPPYGQSLALLADLYQLTMAYAYWKEGIADREAVFHHFFRKAPFGGAFAVAAGIETAVQWLHALRFVEDDVAYLSGLRGQDGRPLFARAFLDYLGEFSFECDIDAVDEGTVVFAQEPLLRVRGPLLQAQVVETALLNLVNFQTLIATKAARVCLAAAGDPVLEFGLRRAQGVDGGLRASRAAYIGGCDATSNLLAGKLYGIPVRGTHAHSWVLSFDSELEAFEAFARAMPNNCVFLVDTYDTMEGVRHAIEVGRKMRGQGLRLAGIRLDSGDLTGLSSQARKLLASAGLDDTAIIASNDLDEYSIADLKLRKASIGIWGVGTSIAAAGGESALGGVYKLSLLRDESGRWREKAKRSEDASKASTPGMLQVRRYTQGGRMKADLIYDELHRPEGPWSGADPERSEVRGEFHDNAARQDLLQPVLRGGRAVGPDVGLDEARQRCRSQLELLPSHIRSLRASRGFPVLFEDGLLRRRERLWDQTGQGRLD